MDNILPGEGAATLAAVKVEGESGPVLVPVSSGKPEVPDQVVEKWQRIVDLAAGIMGVPTGLITRFTRENLEVAVASRTAGNPYKRNDRDRLGIGMFCETVAGRRRPLRVDDSSATEYWRNNPHAGLGMRSYVGVPISWDDGELFGTFCMLTDKANSLQDGFFDLLEQFREIIEGDLRYLSLHEELERRLGERELELREIHHRLKNQLNLIVSYIRLRSHATGDPDIKEVLAEVQHRVLAVSMMHESLSKAAGEGPGPGLDQCLARLCNQILGDLAGGSVTADCLVEPVELPEGMQLNLALIVSELLTNSIKHAFPGGRKGRILVRFGRSGGVEGELSLSYRDDGVGLPASFDPATSGGLGMTIIRAMTSQMGGSMTARSEGGASFEFSFRT